VNLSEIRHQWRLAARIRRQWRLTRIRQWRLAIRRQRRLTRIRQWRLAARNRHYVGHSSPPGCIRVAARGPRQTALNPLRPLTYGIASRDGEI
jgi:hypothetical protein